LPILQLEVKAGVNAGDAIMRILQKRSIDHALCVVRKGPDAYVCTTIVHSTKCIAYSNSEQIMPSMDLAQLAEECTEIWVASTFLQTIMSIKHKFVRKTFFSVTYCDVCTKNIWLQGYRYDLLRVEWVYFAVVTCVV
jgi:hypothetical protein